MNYTARSAALGFLLLLGVQASGRPWAETGNRQLRADVELLKANGLLRGPVNSWPLPWQQVNGALRTAEERQLPPHLAAAVRRLQAEARFAGQARAAEAEIYATNRPQVVRDFGGGARTKGDAAIRAELSGSGLYASASIGYRADQPGPDLNFDNSYVAADLGNWTVYGGLVQQWWGPGIDGALMLSNSARPIPSVGIKRIIPYPIDFPVLRWLGPMRFETWAGVLAEEREFDNALLIGMRLGFEPAPGLELGLTRAMQLCGESRPCSAGMIAKSLIGIANADNTGTFNEPGNQLAGFDVSYSRMIGAVAAKAYFEAVAEDEDNFIIEQFARLGGLDLSGSAGRSGATWQAGIEYADTYGSKFFGGRRYPRSLYNHFIYTDGYRFRGRPIGHSADSDSKVLTLRTSLTDSRDKRWYATARWVRLNVTSDIQPPPPFPTNRVSASTENFVAMLAGVELPLSRGNLRVEGRWEADRPDTPTSRNSAAAIEVGWRSRF